MLLSVVVVVVVVVVTQCVFTANRSSSFGRVFAWAAQRTAVVCVG